MRTFRLWITDSKDCPDVRKDWKKFVAWCESTNANFYDYTVPSDVSDEFVVSKAKSELYQIAFRSGWDGTGQYTSFVVGHKDI